MVNSIIQELNSEADRIIGNKLLPAKSRKQYEQVYKLFTKWQSGKKCFSFSEEILIVYFNEKAKKLEPPSLWSIYSIFRVTIKLSQNIDITNYEKLKSILKFVTKFVYETFYVGFVAGGGLRPPSPHREFAPGPHRSCTPDPRASLHLYSLLRPAHHRMLAIIKVTQAANFNVLIG